MLGDEDKTIRANEVNIAQKIGFAEEGNQEGKRGPDQKFHPPRGNFAATLYTDLQQPPWEWCRLSYPEKGCLMLHEPPSAVPEQGGAGGICPLPFYQEGQGGSTARLK